MSIRFLRDLFGLTLIILLAGCSSAPPPQAAPSQAAGGPAVATAAPETIAATADDPNAAKVCIYRVKEFVGFALRPTVMLDGQDLINVKNGTAWTGSFKPGHYLFQMDDKKSGAALDLKAGETYYFRVDIVMGFWKGGGKMTLMAKEQGIVEAKDLTPLPTGEVAHPAFRAALTN